MATERVKCVLVLGGLPCRRLGRIPKLFCFDLLADFCDFIQAIAEKFMSFYCASRSLDPHFERISSGHAPNIWNMSVTLSRCRFSLLAISVPTICPALVITFRSIKITVTLHGKSCCQDGPSLLLHR